MFLNRKVKDDGTVEFVTPDGYYRLGNMHTVGDDCAEFGCVVHFPTETNRMNREEWPYYWRTDRGLMERLCPHGIGHPDVDAAYFNFRRGLNSENIHGCDGCCR